MKAKKFTTVGFQQIYNNEASPAKFICLLTAQGNQKTLAVSNGRLQFTFSLKPVLDQLGELIVSDDEEEE